MPAPPSYSASAIADDCTWAVDVRLVFLSALEAFVKERKKT
jgi:hypothetical protein